MITNMDIKTIIKDGLTKNHMTQASLAAALGIERATVNRWCVGRAIPEADTFLKVCKILQIHLDCYLFDQPDDMDARLLHVTAQLNQKQKIALLKAILQIMEIVKDKEIG